MVLTRHAGTAENCIDVMEKTMNSKSKLEAAIDARLARIRDHFRDYTAAYVAFGLLWLYAYFSFVTIRPCVRRGSMWAPTPVTSEAKRYFGLDQPCAAKQMFGLAASTSTDTVQPLIGQGIMVWFLGLVFLLGMLVITIGSGRRNSLFRELSARHAGLMEQLVASVLHSDAPREPSAAPMPVTTHSGMPAP
jgi:hypothetical protein